MTSKTTLLERASEGRNEYAIGKLEEGLAEDRRDGYAGTETGVTHFAKALLHLTREETNLALAEARNFSAVIHGLNPTGPDYGRGLVASVLAYAGRTAEADEVLKAMRADFEANPAGRMEEYWEAEAVEKYEESLEIWKDADPGIHEVDEARERLLRLKGPS